MTGSIVPVAAQLVCCVSAKTCYRELASERTMIQTGKISRRKMVNEEMNEGKQRERGRENHRERRREQERLEKEREEGREGGRDGGRETQGGRVVNHAVLFHLVSSPLYGVLYVGRKGLECTVRYIFVRRILLTGVGFS